MDRIVSGRTSTVGLCGSQGSGKSTAAAKVMGRLQAVGLKTALLSLDDLYLNRARRAELAREVHPLLATRGVPGTHDVALGERVLDGLARDGLTTLPRFDKGQDEPAPADDRPRLQGPVDVILFEGWCVGAAPQADGDLLEPVNALERNEDREGVWRRYVNAALQGDYNRLFERLDALVLLAAPDFTTVLNWRREQERGLRARLAAEGRSMERTMDDEAVERFVRHYERLTRHILAEMPARADLTLSLDEQRRAIGSRVGSRPAQP
jgi:D-glycerate 3-kinase